MYSIKQAGQDPMRYYDLHKGTCRETLDAWNQLYTGPSKWKLIKDVEKISYNNIAVILVTVNVWHCQGCKFWKIRSWHLTSNECHWVRLLSSLRMLSSIEYQRKSLYSRMKYAPHTCIALLPVDPFQLWVKSKIKRWYIC